MASHVFKAELYDVQLFIPWECTVSLGFDFVHAGPLCSNLNCRSNRLIEDKLHPKA